MSAQTQRVDLPDGVDPSNTRVATIAKTSPLSPFQFSRLLVGLIACFFFLRSATFQFDSRDAESCASWLVGLGIILSFALWDARKNIRVNRRDLILASIITLGAFILRVWQIRTLPGFIDRDDVYIGESAQRLSQDLRGFLGIFWGGYAIFGIWFQALLFKLFGPSVTHLRLAQAIHGSVAVFALFYLGKTLVNRRVGAAAAILLAVSHASINYSRIGSGYIQTAMWGILLMVCSIQSFRGGTLLATVGAALSLALGIMSYQASYIFPPLLVASVLPFILEARTSRGRWRVVMRLISIIALGLCMASPPFAEMIKKVDWTMSRPATLLMNKAALESLAKWYVMDPNNLGTVFAYHLSRAFGVFWNGSDLLPVYGVNYPLLDVVTGSLFALLPLLFIRQRQIAWVCLVWCVGFVFFGAGLCGEPVTFRRLLATIPFAILAGTTLVDSFLPNRLRAFGLAAVCCAAAYVNLSWYFVKYPATHPVPAMTKLTQIVCEYADSHFIVDASAPGDTRGWGAEYRELLKLDCGNLRLLEVPGGKSLWSVIPQGEEKILVMVATEIVREIGIRAPETYSVTRTWNDNSIDWPNPLPLTMLELKRKGA